MKKNYTLHLLLTSSFLYYSCAKSKLINDSSIKTNRLLPKGTEEDSKKNNSNKTFCGLKSGFFNEKSKEFIKKEQPTEIKTAIKNEPEKKTTRLVEEIPEDDPFELEDIEHSDQEIIKKIFNNFNNLKVFLLYRKKGFYILRIKSLSTNNMSFDRIRIMPIHTRLNENGSITLPDDDQFPNYMVNLKIIIQYTLIILENLNKMPFPLRIFNKFLIPSENAYMYTGDEHIALLTEKLKEKMNKNLDPKTMIKETIKEIGMEFFRLKEIESSKKTDPFPKISSPTELTEHNLKLFTKEEEKKYYENYLGKEVISEITQMKKRGETFEKIYEKIKPTLKTNTEKKRRDEVIEEIKWKNRAFTFFAILGVTIIFRVGLTIYGA